MRILILIIILRKIMPDMIIYIHGEHKLFSWLQTFITRKLRGFFFNV